MPQSVVAQVRAGSTVVGPEALHAVGDLIARRSDLNLGCLVTVVDRRVTTTVVSAAVIVVPIIAAAIAIAETGASEAQAKTETKTAIAASATMAVTASTVEAVAIACEASAVPASAGTTRSSQTLLQAAVGNGVATT